MNQVLFRKCDKIDYMALFVLSGNWFLTYKMWEYKLGNSLYMHMFSKDLQILIDHKSKMSH